MISYLCSVVEAFFAVIRLICSQRLVIFNDIDVP